MMPHRIAKCDKITMEVLAEYATCTEAAEASGVSMNTICASCRNRAVGKFDYVWRYAEDVDPRESFEGKCNRPVLVGDYEKNTIRAYPTLSDAAMVLGVDDSTVSRAIRMYAMIKGRYRVRYAR